NRCAAQDARWAWANCVGAAFLRDPAGFWQRTAILPRRQIGRDSSMVVHDLAHLSSGLGLGERLGRERQLVIRLTRLLRISREDNKGTTVASMCAAVAT